MNKDQLQELAEEISAMKSAGHDVQQTEITYQYWYKILTQTEGERDVRC